MHQHRSELQAEGHVNANTPLRIVYTMFRQNHLFKQKCNTEAKFMNKEVLLFRLEERRLIREIPLLTSAFHLGFVQYHRWIQWRGAGIQFIGSALHSHVTFIWPSVNPYHAWLAFKRAHEASAYTVSTTRLMQLGFVRWLEFTRDVHSPGGEHLRDTVDEAFQLFIDEPEVAIEYINKVLPFERLLLHVLTCFWRTLNPEEAAAMDAAPTDD